MSLMERLMEKSVVLKNGCIEWRGYRPSNRNYGLIRTGKRKQEKVQNVVYRTFFGPVPKGFFVVNSCGNRFCINHKHLMLVKRNQQWRRDPVKRLEKNTVKIDSGCWEWQGAKTKFGYGQMVVDGKVEIIPRFTYRMFVGPIPEGMYVCHKCDNPSCWNPDHLYLGTAQDNARDRVERGRNAPKSGTFNGRSILVDTDVVEIRSRYKKGGISMSELARQHGVSFGTISRVVKKQGWCHVPDEDISSDRK